MVEARVIVAELARARGRCERALASLSEEQLMRQVSPLMSPLVWDYAHIGHFEELWLLRELGGQPPTRADHDDVYDAFAHERSERAELPLLPPAAARAFVADVRSRVLALVDELRFDGDQPLLARGFGFGMVIQHELQHVETMIQTQQLAGFRASLQARRRRSRPRASCACRRGRSRSAPARRKRGPTTASARHTRSF